MSGPEITVFTAGNVRKAQVKGRPELVPDARLERLASERGPASAEAYVVLELREVRSAGNHVFAFQTNGRYTVGSAPQPSP